MSILSISPAKNTDYYEKDNISNGNKNLTEEQRKEQNKNYYEADNLKQAEFYGKLAQEHNLKNYSQDKYAELAEGKLGEQQLNKKYNAKATEEALKRWEENGKQGEEPGKKHTHSTGQDFDFSASKSYSICATLGDDKMKNDFQTAWNDSVNETLDHIEKNYAGYKKYDKENGDSFEHTGKIAVAKFTHDKARPVKDENGNIHIDPQLHTHCVTFNMQKDENGNIKAMDFSEAYKAKMESGAHFDMTLAKKIQDKGYNIDMNKDGTFEVRGISQEAIDHFSKRRTQSLKYCEENGLDPKNAKHMQVAVHETRAYKIDVDSKELQAQWKKDFKEKGFNFDNVKSSEKVLESTGNKDVFENKYSSADKKYLVDKEMHNKEPVKLDKDFFTKEENATRSLNYSITKLSENDTTFEKRNLMRYAKIDGTGNGIAPKDIEKAYNNEIEKGNLIEKTDGTLTTKKAVEIERENIAMLNRGKGSTRAIVQDGYVDFTEFQNKKAEEFGVDKVSLKDSQREAAENILTSKDRFVGTQGLAGTGKTFALEGIKQVSEKNNYQIVGAAPSNVATKNIYTEAGIYSQNVDKMLSDMEKGNFKRQTYDKNDGYGVTQHQKPLVVMVDESSMIGSENINRLMKQAEQKDFKIAFVGDRDQFSSISAGDGFAQLQDAGMKTKTMDEINRQKSESELLNLKESGFISDSPKLREAVYNIYDKQMDKALEKIPIHEVKNNHDKLLEKVVDEYNKFKEQDRMRLDSSGTVAIVSTNSDRMKVNSMIREGMKERGELTGDEIKTSIYTKKNFAEADKTKYLQYDEGDVIKFGKNSHGKGYKTLGLSGEGTAKVIGHDKVNHKVKLEFEDGRKIDWKPITRGKAYNCKVYREHEEKMMKGDHIKFNDNFKDGKNSYHNNQGATVMEVNEKGARIQLDNGKERFIDFDKIKNFQTNYAYTSHSSQGITRSNSISLYAEKDAGLGGEQQALVNISRAKENAVIITDNKETLLNRITKNQSNTRALDNLPEKPVSSDLEKKQPDKSIDKLNENIEPKKADKIPEKDLDSILKDIKSKSKEKSKDKSIDSKDSKDKPKDKPKEKTREKGLELSR